MFSLIVPAHNEEKTLTATLAALVRQEYVEPYEIVVACNGCSDGTGELARKFFKQNARENGFTKVVESPRAGMSFGKNFGAENARGDFLIFVDADTILPTDSLATYAKKIAGRNAIIGTVAGKPDRGGVVVKTCFFIANLFTRIKKVHAPGGVMLMSKAVWERARFDENLPQGTSSDLIMRAIADGAEYVFIDKPAAITSIRRFEKTGIIRQMFAWRKNHQDLRKNSRAEVAKREYRNIR